VPSESPINLTAAQQEDRFRYLIENGREAVLLINQEGVITYATPNLHRVLGYSAEEYVGRNAFAIVHPEDLAKATELFESLLGAPGKIGTTVIRAQAKTGPWRWIEGTGQNLLATPQIKAVVCNIRDITTEREAQLALRQNEELNTRILESLPAGVLKVDQSGQVRHANELAMTMLGRRTDHQLDVRDALGNATYPNGQVCLLHEHPVFRCLKTGERQTSIILGLQKPNGSTLWAAQSAAPFFDPASGQQDGAVLSLVDVTAQVEAERKLRLNEARLETIARATLDAIWDWDIENDVLRWNANYSSMFGYTEEDTPRTLADCQQRCHPEDAARARPSFQRALDGSDPIWCEEFRYRRADGTYAHVYNRSYIIRNDQGRAVRVLSAMMDVTKLKEAEAELSRSYERLRHAQKMESLGQLAGGVAHDFNNILTVIEGHAELLKREAKSPDARESAEEIISAVIRASSLTRQLLTFSRKNIFHPVPIRLNELVQGLGKMLRRIVGEHISLEISTPEESPVVRADRGMLEQVILNLVINARDAMPDGGQLGISIEHALPPDENLSKTSVDPFVNRRFARLRVEDCGCGIAAEHLEKIFEPFFTTKTEGKGTGLGLATVYGIIQQHSGIVKVRSVAGKGTVFDVFLPVTDEVPRFDLPAKAAPATGGSETILLVEDEPALLLLAATILQRFGYKVLTAVTGGEALNIWNQEKERIGLLVTDMVMPGKISGKTLGLQLSREKPALRVVYTSGYSDELGDQDFVRVSRGSFLPKPYTPEQLVRAVRETLDGRGSK
jgi:two-component system, cell cycle sensor histidine kinase and response regulator CckA